MEEREANSFTNWVWPDCPDDTESERPFEFSIIRAEDNGRIALLLMLLATALTAPHLLTNPLLAYTGLIIGAFLSLWTRFEARWAEYRRAGTLRNGAVVIVLSDFAWLAMFVAGTGGIASPFVALLTLPILFAVALFSRMKLALMLVTALVVTAYAAMVLATGFTTESSWQLAGMLISVMAIAWVAHGVCIVLERERRTNELVIRNMSEALLLLDSDRHIVVANRQVRGLTGVSPSEIVGRHAREVAEDEATSALAPILQDVISPVGDDTHLFRDLTLTGPEIIDVRVTTARCIASGSESVGHVVICQDVTAMKAAMRMQENGISMLSHEIRSPLTTLRVTASMISALADRLSDENMAQFASVLDSETQRLVWMAGELLNVSTLENTNTQISLEPTDVEALLRRLRRVVEVRSQRKRIRVTGTVEGDLSEIAVDPERMTSALHRLCDNALKYTDEGGEISIDARRTSDRLFISIADTGVGIPQESQHLIYDKFAQLQSDGARDRDERGAGLGLYVVRRIVELHGGMVHLDSEPGKGSTFTIELPVPSGNGKSDKNAVPAELRAVEA